MYKTLILLGLSTFLFSCSTQRNISNNYESETLKIKPLDDNIFVHISYLKTNDFGNVACNGMVYFNEDEAIVFDTPTDDLTSKELINWIEKEQKKKIKAVVITHFHVDCLGGLQEFHNKEIASYATHKTIELAREEKQETLPKNGFNDRMEIRIGQQAVFAEFFGEGHTADNIVGYIPEEKALFGGCLIKSVNASKGYLGDASVSDWSATVLKIKEEMPDLKIVIPGHGKNGGTELLDYTIELFEEN